MSSQHRKDLPGEGAAERISEEAIVHYLQTHPEFFERHSQVLASVRVPHASGPAVSLVERQVTILRSRNAKLDRKLQELIANARTNDVLASKIHGLACRLLLAKSQSQVLHEIADCLQHDFNAEFTTLLVFRSETHEHDEGIMRVVDRGSDSLNAFASALEMKAPRCGRLTEAQRELLFAGHAGEVKSAALAPLGQGRSLGLLAVGSRASDRFLPTMSVEFLSHIGELVATALRARPAAAS